MKKIDIIEYKKLTINVSTEAKVCILTIHKDLYGVIEKHPYLKFGYAVKSKRLILKPCDESDDYTVNMGNKMINKHLIESFKKRGFKGIIQFKYNKVNEWFETGDKPTKRINNVEWFETRLFNASVIINKKDIYLNSSLMDKLSTIEAFKIGWSTKQKNLVLMPSKPGADTFKLASKINNIQLNSKLKELKFNGTISMFFNKEKGWYESAASSTDSENDIKWFNKEKDGLLSYALTIPSSENGREIYLSSALFKFLSPYGFFKIGINKDEHIFVVAPAKEDDSGALPLTRKISNQALLNLIREENFSGAIKLKFNQTKQWFESL